MRKVPTIMSGGRHQQQIENKYNIIDPTWDASFDCKEMNDGQ